MAGSRIQGITIEIDGNTTKLSRALSDVDRELSKTQSSLKDVEKLLKFDPGNTELLRQQQQYLQQAIDLTQQRLERLNDIMAENGESLPDDEYNALQREITATEQQLATYEQQAADAAAASEEMGDGASDAGSGAAEAASGFDEAGDAAEDAGKGMSEAGDAAEDAGDDAESGSEGWTIAKQILADLAEQAIKAAVDGLKDLGKAMKDAVTDSAAFADEILTTSAQTHIGTDALQELAYSAELIDVPMDTVTKSLTKLTGKMGDAAEEGSSSAQMFEDLGISIRDSATGEMRSAEDVFYDAIDALGGIQNETERDAVAMELFGKSAKDLNPLIDIGSEGLQQYADEAHEMGAVLDSDALGALGGMDDAFVRLDQQTEVVKRQFATALAPAITEVTNALTEMSADQDWQAMFSELGSAVEGILPDLLNMAKTVLPAIINICDALMPIISEIIGQLPALQPAIDEIVSVIQRLAPMLAQLIAQLLPALINIIDAVLPILEPIMDILEPLLQILGPLLSAVLNALSVVLKALVQVITGLCQPAIKALQNAAEKLAPVFQNMSQVLGNVSQTMGNAWTAIKTAAQTAVNAVKSVIETAWNAIKNVTTTVWNGMKNIITKPIEAARDVVKNVVDKIQGFFSNAKLKFPDLKLPHVSITGKFSLSPPSVPKFSISWYAKAMQDGMILDDPTIFGMMGGKFLGAGEAGPEAIVGVSSLRDMIREAVGSTTNNNFGGVNVVVYGAPGQDVNELADIIEDRINSNIARRRAAF